MEDKEKMESTQTVEETKTEETSMEKEAAKPDSIEEKKSETTSSDSTNTTNTPNANKVEGNEDAFAIGSLVLGIINLCSWFIPLCGCPMAIIGIVLGYLGMKSTKNATYAKIGMVLSIIGIVLTIINAVAGAYLGFSNPDLYNFGSY